MIKAVHEVLLHDEHIGSIRRRGDFTKFAFDRGYWDRPDRAVLGEWFEGHPRRRPHAVNRVPAWFSNLLPEGRLRDMVVEARGGDGREIDLLLRAGRDLPGAVKVVAGGAGVAGCTGGACAHPRSAGRAVAPGRLGFALAGMTLKFSMSRRGDRLVVPARGRDGDWILKAPDRSYPDLPANELAVMRLAGSVGIDVPEARLWSRDDIDDLGPGAWTSEETRAYAVRRFDRSPGGRVHIEDFAQVLGRFGAGEGKYRSNVETVAGLAHRGRDRASLREAVRRTVFNLLVGNGDVHLKNWSLIYPDRRRARLSPAYDLVCTAVHLPDPGNPLLGLPFLGATRLADVGRGHFARLRDRLGVGDEDVLGVVDETCERFRGLWADGAADRMPPPVAEWIGAHLEDTLSRLRGES